MFNLTMFFQLISLASFYFTFFTIMPLSSSLAEDVPNKLGDSRWHHYRHHHHYHHQQNSKGFFGRKKGNSFNVMNRRDGHSSRLSHSQFKWSQNFVSPVQTPISLNRRSASKVTRRGGNSASSQKRPKQPNIIFILTDDQDIELGSMNFMPKTLKVLKEGGAHFPNAYVTTPMCCPSRSSILTGLYVHNHNVYTNNDNCSSPQWQNTYETRTFATYLQRAGYRTAYFGKYLNEYNGTYIPPGWSEWSALVRNSRFYNYTLNVNGQKIKHGNDYQLDYYPDLIVNDSLQFLKYSKRFFANKPLMMVLSFPSPHGPEDAAPQYQHLFFNVTTHRTKNWNYAPNLDKQWLLRNTGKMQEIHQQFTDLLHTKRLQTLQTVDDAVQRLYDELKSIDEIDNTYIFYTSDHGYHLGQFGLVKGKSMPFEFDVRIPFYVRGPKIAAGSTINGIVLNIDLAPTFLEIAGVEVPDQMDGKSFVPLFTQSYESVKKENNTQGHQKVFWRDTFLIERGKSLKESESTNTLGKSLSKREWLALECRKPEYRSPCGSSQKWECVSDGLEMRIRKCRKTPAISRHFRKQKCYCDTGFDDASYFGDNFNVNDHTDGSIESSVESGIVISRRKKPRLLDPLEKKLQRKFLKKHVINRNFKPIFIGPRTKRDLSVDTLSDDFDVDGVYQLSQILDVNIAKSVNESNSILTNNQSIDRTSTNLDTDCVILSNHSVSCSSAVYHNKQVWRKKKERLNSMIEKLQVKLEKLRGIRRHLNQKRPLLSNGNPQSTDCFCDYKKRYRGLPSEGFKPRYSKRRFQFRNKARRKEKKLRRKIKFENTTCNYEKMNCFTHDNDHWKTAPFWTKGPFCFCQNSNNNSYECLRTINSTHNFLYCEFITGYLTFYNLRQDPFQLRNAIYDLELSTLEELRLKLNKMKTCAGTKDCTFSYNQNDNDAN